MRLLLPLAAACLLLAGLALYGSRAVVDESAFADRAMQALARPDVRAEVAARLQDRLLAEHPELRPGPLHAAVTAAVDDPRFAPAFREGIARMHEALFERGSHEIPLTVPGAGRMMRTNVEAPPVLTLGSGGSLERRLLQAAPVAGDLARLWPVPLAIGLLLLGLARSLRDAGLALAAAGALAAAATVAAEVALLRTFTSAHGESVVEAIWDSYLAGLRTWGLVAAAGGLALAAATLLRMPPRPAAGLPPAAPADASSPGRSSTWSPR